MSVYRVDFLAGKDMGLNPTYMYVRGKNKADAQENLKVLEKRTGTKIGPTLMEKLPVDEVLQQWYDIDPVTYMDCWEPDITNKEILKRFKERFPEQHHRLIGD